VTTLSVFGSCNVLNCSIDKTFDNIDTNSWTHFACLNLNLVHKNFAKKSVDNNYLYDLVLTNIKDLCPSENVILVAWCDISSKLFLSSMLDDNARTYSIVYDHGLLGDNWARSSGPTKAGWDGEFDYNKNFGNPYYDCYFQNYFHNDIGLLETWQKASSLSAILSTLKFKHIFTSDRNLFNSSGYQELIKGHTNWFYPDNLGIVEFAKHHGVVNSPSDKHLSYTGHKKLAQIFTSYYNELQY